MEQDHPNIKTVDTLKKTTAGANPNDAKPKAQSAFVNALDESADNYGDSEPGMRNQQPQEPSKKTE